MVTNVPWGHFAAAKVPLVHVREYVRRPAGSCGVGPKSEHVREHMRRYPLSF